MTLSIEISQLNFLGQNKRTSTAHKAIMTIWRFAGRSFGVVWFELLSDVLIKLTHFHWKLSPPLGIVIVYDGPQYIRLLRQVGFMIQIDCRSVTPAC